MRTSGLLPQENENNTVAQVQNEDVYTRYRFGPPCRRQQEQRLGGGATTETSTDGGQMDTRVHRQAYSSHRTFNIHTCA